MISLPHRGKCGTQGCKPAELCHSSVREIPMGFADGRMASGAHDKGDAEVKILNLKKGPPLTYL